MLQPRKGLPFCVFFFLKSLLSLWLITAITVWAEWCPALPHAGSHKMKSSYYSTNHFHSFFKLFINPGPRGGRAEGKNTASPYFVLLLSPPLFFSSSGDGPRQFTICQTQVVIETLRALRTEIKHCRWRVGRRFLVLRSPTACQCYSFPMILLNILPPPELFPETDLNPQSEIPAPFKTVLKLPKINQSINHTGLKWTKTIETICLACAILALEEMSILL